ncbi:MAG: bromoperoxidase, partial [Acidobacteriota bacterium]
GDGCWNRHLRDGAADLPTIDGMNLLAAVAEHNADQNTAPDRLGDLSAGSPSFLLPMAFPEGSPMHPAYGAGHATVAGACVTVLKAYFDHGFPITEKTGGVWEADPKTRGRSLRQAECCGPLTVEGELNKLASNISIGRDWAGVHYFTDYIESIRLGEQIALGLLEEQKLTYRENFRMTVPLFSGEVVRI